MNRKVATLIILVVFLLSLVLVSILGTDPKEWATNTRIKAIYIADSPMGIPLPTTKIGEQELVQLEIVINEDEELQEGQVRVKSGEDTLTFYYGVEPVKAKNLQVDIVLPGPVTDDPEEFYTAKLIEIINSGGGSVTIKWKQFNNDGTIYVPESGFILTLTGDNGSASTSINFWMKTQTSGETEL